MRLAQVFRYSMYQQSERGVRQGDTLFGNVLLEHSLFSLFL